MDGHTRLRRNVRIRDEVELERISGAKVPDRVEEERTTLAHEVPADEQDADWITGAEVVHALAADLEVRGCGALREDVDLPRCHSVIADQRIASPLGPRHQSTRGIEDGSVEAMLALVESAARRWTMSVRAADAVIVDRSRIKRHDRRDPSHQADGEERRDLGMEEQRLMRSRREHAIELAASSIARADRPVGGVPRHQALEPARRVRDRHPCRSYP